MIDGIIIKGVGGLYFVFTAEGLFECNARGVFRKKNLTPLVGDHVRIKIQDGEKKTASIEAIKNRKNEMLRPRVANVDQAAIVLAAANPELNLNLLDRFIILAENEGLESLICINKIDLDISGHGEETARLYEGIGYPVIMVSAAVGTGMKALSERLDNKVTVFAGPSGVGKSSLINMLIPGAELETGELSKKIDRGKHTTRHAELMEVGADSFVVDTPGFTSLSYEHIDVKRLPYLFREFRPFLDGCRFNDCKHLKEIDCLVKEKVGTDIPRQRYERYWDMYHEMTGRG